MPVSRCARRFVLALSIAPILLLPPAAAPLAEEDRLAGPEVTLTRVGGPVPQFAVRTLAGESLDAARLKGKILVINFWATWCPACEQEMPRLEKEVWQGLKSPGLALVAIAREQTEGEIGPWKKEHKLTLPLAADPARDIYRKFATEGIPRTYVVGTDGHILFQSIGYDPAEFHRMTVLIRGELARIAAR
jgi:peroxiredoxin